MFHMQLSYIFRGNNFQGIGEQRGLPEVLNRKKYAYLIPTSIVRYLDADPGFPQVLGQIYISPQIPGVVECHNKSILHISPSQGLEGCKA